MTNFEDKTVSGGVIWNPRYEPALTAGIVNAKIRSKFLFQGILFLSIGLSLIIFIFIQKIIMVLPQENISYYRIPDLTNPIIVILPMIGSLLLGVGIGRIIASFLIPPRSKTKIFVTIFLSLILIGVVNFGAAITITNTANSSFSSWLSSSHKLSSFVEEKPNLKELSDKPVEMLTTSGKKVTVTFKQTGDKLTVANIIQETSSK